MTLRISNSNWKPPRLMKSTKLLKMGSIIALCSMIAMTDAELLYKAMASVWKSIDLYCLVLAVSIAYLSSESKICTTVTKADSIAPGSYSNRTIRQRRMVMPSYLCSLFWLENKTRFTISMIWWKKLWPYSVVVRNVAGSLLIKFWMQTTTYSSYSEANPPSLSKPLPATR